MQCPKCGRSSESGAVICPGCDYILDASFLGDDILNELNERNERGEVQPARRTSSPSDALVFGALGEPVELMFSENTGSFLTADTQEVSREILLAAIYVGASVQALMKPEAVLAQAADIEQRKNVLSPFELHVLSFIDGQRPVARLRVKTGLSMTDLRIAVGMLAEKGAVVLAGNVARPNLKHMLAGELDTDDGIDIELPDDDASAPRDLSAPSPAADDAVAPASEADESARKDQAEGFYELATAELEDGNRVRAHIYARLALEHDPGEPRYRELLKEWALPRRTMTTAEALLFTNADAAETAGDHKKALAFIEQALAANPDAAYIHNRMGLLLALRFKKMPQATEHLTKACELEPNNVVYRNNLGKLIAAGGARAQRAMAKTSQDKAVVAAAAKGPLA